VLREQGPRAEPLPHVDDDGVAAARVDAPARLHLAVALPQRPRHRHHQGPAERRGEAERQREEDQQEGARHQAMGQAGTALPRVLHHQEQLGGQGGRGENRIEERRSLPGARIIKLYKGCFFASTPIEVMILPPFQNVGHFDISKFIYFTMNLDICYI